MSGCKEFIPVFEVVVSEMLSFISSLKKFCYESDML
jgi:hypothetical protein